MQFRPEKKLGFGLMRLPQLDPADASKIDIEQIYGKPLPKKDAEEKEQQGDEKDEG